MERLPFEIQVQILSHLPSKDRFVCLYVSKAWNTVAQTCVFSDICIDNDGKLTGALTFFQNNSNLAKKVTSISIDDCENIYQYLLPLKQVFINLEEFKADLVESDIRFYSRNNHQVGAWEKIQMLQTKESFEENKPSVLELLLSVHCPSLSEIQAKFARYGNATNAQRQNHCVRLLHLLNNAPELTVLEFSYLNCGIHDLEILHQNAPKLQKLVLSKHTDISLPVTTLRNLETISLSHLEICFYWRLQPNHETLIVALCDYIGRKYQGLSSLIITCDMEESAGRRLDLVYRTFNTNAIDQKILPLFTKCLGLVHYDQIFSPLSSAITEEMDRCEIRLNKLTLYLDKATMDNQLSTLIRSHQSLSLVELTIYMLDEYHVNDEPRMRPSLQFMTMANLTKLALYGNYSPICFTALIGFLENCPQLRVFALDNTKVLNTSVNLDSDFPQVALKSLSISSLEIGSVPELQVTIAIFKKILPRCLQLREFDLDFVFTRPIKSGETHSLPIILDFSRQMNLKKIGFRGPGVRYRYYIESPRTLGCFHEVHGKLVRTDSFQPDEYYIKILLSQSTTLNGISIS